jgi:hypothetical protein
VLLLTGILSNVHYNAITVIIVCFPIQWPAQSCQNIVSSAFLSAARTKILFYGRSRGEEIRIQHKKLRYN